MKRVLLSLSTVVLLVGLVGCAADRGCRMASCPGDGCPAACEKPCSCGECGEGCNNVCDDPNACEEELGTPLLDRLRCWWNRERLCDKPRKQKVCAEPSYPPGPPTGQVTYPYYTVRGPRDFLAKNPGSIGP